MRRRQSVWSTVVTASSRSDSTSGGPAWLEKKKARTTLISDSEKKGAGVSADGGSGPWIKSTGEIGSIDRRCEGWRRSVRHSRNSLKKSIKPFDLSARTGTPGIPFLPSLPRSKSYDPPRSRNKRTRDTFKREEHKWIHWTIYMNSYSLKSANNIAELTLLQLIN